MSSEYSFGNFVLKEKGNGFKLYKTISEGTEHLIELTSKNLLFLELLVKRKHQSIYSEKSDVLLRSEILDLVWGSETYVNDENINGIVKDLRNVLGRFPEYIQNVRKNQSAAKKNISASLTEGGYRLICGVEKRVRLEVPELIRILENLANDAKLIFQLKQISAISGQANLIKRDILSKENEFYTKLSELAAGVGNRSNDVEQILSFVSRYYEIDWFQRNSREISDMWQPLVDKVLFFKDIENKLFLNLLIQRGKRFFEIDPLQFLKDLQNAYGLVNELEARNKLSGIEAAQRRIEIFDFLCISNPENGISFREQSLDFPDKVQRERLFVRSLVCSACPYLRENNLLKAEQFLCEAQDKLAAIQHRLRNTSMPRPTEAYLDLNFGILFYLKQEFGHSLRYLESAELSLTESIKQDHSAFMVINYLKFMIYSSDQNAIEANKYLIETNFHCQSATIPRFCSFNCDEIHTLLFKETFIER